MYQPTAAKPTRPAVVTIAAAVMGLLAALNLLNGIVGFAAISDAVDTFRALARDEGLGSDEIDAGVAATWVGLAGSGVIAVLFSLLLAGLAWGVLRGSQGARVVTWIVCGLGVLCGCCNGFGSLATFSEAGSATGDPDQVLGSLIMRAVPDWAGGVLAGSSCLGVLGYIATAVLLALPAASAFFRGYPPAGWQPPSYPPPSTPFPPPPAHPAHPAPPPSTL